jgi:hypothetical protein
MEFAAMAETGPAAPAVTPVYSSPRSPSMALGWALAAVVFLVSGVLLVVALSISGDSKEPRAARRPAEPARAAPRPQRSPEDVWATTRQEESSSWALRLLALGIAYVVGVVLMLAWVAKDSRCRGVDGGAVWVMVILFTGIIGLLVYLASRPSGILVPCSTCSNRRLNYSRLCPHCGNA